MKKIWILTVLIQIVYPAFETAFKFQYLGSERYLFTAQDSTYLKKSQHSFGLVYPFGKSFLKLTTLNYQRRILNGSLQFYLTTSGDKLYRETMLENQVQFPIHQNYRLGIILDSYLISVKNYPSQSTVSSGLQLIYQNLENYFYFIEYKNSFFLINRKLKNDIPEQILISLYYKNKKNRFKVAIVKDMASPIDLQLSWNNRVHDSLSLNFGIFNTSREILMGIGIRSRLLNPFIFILFHPELGFSYGGKIQF